MSISQYEASPLRWYILGVFCVLSALQSFAWLLYSAAATDSILTFHTTQSWINFWLAMGPIGFLPGQVVVWWLLSRPNGVQSVVYMGAFTVWLGAVFRLLPQAFFVLSRGTPANILISVGQFWNAVAGPAVMSVVSQLAALWFPDNFRVTATAIAGQSNYTGNLIGFVVIPYVADCCHITSVCWAIGFLSTAVLLCVLLYFPATPPTPPSASAAQCQEFTGVVDSGFFKKTISDIVRCASIPPLHIMLIAQGANVGGLLAAWTGLFDPLFTHLYINESSKKVDVFAGWMGFEVTLSGVVAATTASVVQDQIFRHRKRHKHMSIVGAVTATLGFAICVFVFPSPFSDKPLLPHGHAIVAVFFFIVGSGVGLPNAIVTDWAAEMSFPLNEGVSCGLYCIWINIFAGIILLIQNKIPYRMLNTICFGMSCVVLLTMCFIKQDFKRSNYEAAVKEGLVEPILNSTGYGTVEQNEGLVNKSDTTSLMQ